ncbi:uncharacterized protein LOC143489322 [Brachyhypopomus gauderio]|uniref:uncharacterized protein LOC143489322 n=1 Tax=Brachyhypopomus gauderio TaxID=698409 RepID=UPI004042752B
MVQRWPALFTESQVFQEFSRVVGKNLKDNFFDALDRFSPSLMELFRKKRGLTGQLLAALYVRQRPLSLQMLGAFAFGGCQSSWEMIILLSSGLQMIQLTRTCTAKLQWGFSALMKTILSRAQSELGSSWKGIL